MENKQFWKLLSGIFIVSIILAGLIGYTIGFFINEKKNNFCSSNALIYGIQEINLLNKADFLCTCNSNDGLNFYFNENKLVNGNPYLD